MNSHRQPTMDSALAALSTFGVKINTVIDIGVLTGTDYLIRHFPSAVHHLFEPLDSYAGTIEENYKSVTHELNVVALSSDIGEAFQVGLGSNAGGATLTSQLSERYLPVGSVHNGATVTECKSIMKTTLDAHFAAKGTPRPPYLVKIDVDGHEMPIIDGGTGILKGADIVIIEAPVAALVERGTAIQVLGFQVIDIVDLFYFHNTLSQVDLILANKKLLLSTPDLQPWNTKPFSREAWFSFSGKLFELSKY